MVGGPYCRIPRHVGRSTRFTLCEQGTLRRSDMENARMINASRRYIVRRLVGLTVVISAVGMAAPSTQAKPLRSRSFQTPSGNISCHLQRSPGGMLRCDIFSGLKPEPKKKCDYDWVGLLLGRYGRARPNCASDTVPNNDPPVLHYGHRWRARRLECLSARKGLRCRNFSGYNFRLSRHDWDRWYQP